MTHAPILGGWLQVSRISGAIQHCYVIKTAIPIGKTLLCYYLLPHDNCQLVELR